MENESIEFSARYKDWIVIKRAKIYEDTTPEEIVFNLASIRQSLDRKAFEILGIDTKVLDEYADKTTNNARKSYVNLAQCMQALGSSEARGIVEKACNGKERLNEVASTYLFRKVVQNLKFDFDVNQEMLSKAYPNLKLPAPRGRKPKKE